METIRGRILSVHTDRGVRVAIVEVESAPACPRCAAGKGCGAGLAAASDGPRRIEARLSDGFDLDAGDVVEVGIRPGELLGAAATVYGLPLAGATVGASLAWITAAGDAAAAAGAITGCVFGMFLARRRLGTGRCVAMVTPAARTNEAA